MATPNIQNLTIFYPYNTTGLIIFLLNLEMIKGLQLYSLPSVINVFFYLNPIEQLLHFVEQLDQLEVCLPCSRLLTKIPILLGFKELWCSNNKMTLIHFNSEKRRRIPLPNKKISSCIFIYLQTPLPMCLKKSMLSVNAS